MGVSAQEHLHSQINRKNLTLASIFFVTLHISNKSLDSGLSSLCLCLLQWQPLDTYQNPPVRCFVFKNFVSSLSSRIFNVVSTALLFYDKEQFYIEIHSPMDLCSGSNPKHCVILLKTKQTKKFKPNTYH